MSKDEVPEAIRDLEGGWQDEARLHAQGRDKAPRDMGFCVSRFVGQIVWRSQKSQPGLLSETREDDGVFSDVAKSGMAGDLFLSLGEC